MGIQRRHDEAKRVEDKVVQTLIKPEKDHMHVKDTPLVEKLIKEKLADAVKHTAESAWRDVDVNEDNVTTLAEVETACQKGKLRSTTALTKMNKLERFAIDLFDYSCTSCADPRPGKSFLVQFDKYLADDRKCRGISCRKA